MSWEHKEIVKTMPGGATQTTLVLDLGNAYPKVWLQIPTMGTAAGFQVDGATRTITGYGPSTFYKLAVDDTDSAQTFTIGATAAANGRMARLPGGFQHYRLVADTAPTSATEFRMVGVGS